MPRGSAPGQRWARCGHIWVARRRAGVDGGRSRLVRVLGSESITRLGPAAVPELVVRQVNQREAPEFADLGRNKRQAVVIQVEERQELHLEQLRPNHQQACSAPTESGR